MGTNITAFGPALDREIEETKTQLIVEHRNVIAGFIEIVSENTPFKTGHAMTNWQISIGGEDVPELFDEPQSTADIVRRARSKLKNLSSHDDVDAVNEAPYISFLNEGSSSQAQAGFIELSVEEAELLLGS